MTPKRPAPSKQVCQNDYLRQIVGAKMSWRKNKSSPIWMKCKWLVGKSTAPYYQSPNCTDIKASHSDSEWPKSGKKTFSNTSMNWFIYVYCSFSYIYFTRIKVSLLKTNETALRVVWNCVVSNEQPNYEFYARLRHWFREILHGQRDCNLFWTQVNIFFAAISVNLVYLHNLPGLII